MATVRYIWINKKMSLILILPFFYSHEDQSDTGFAFGTSVFAWTREKTLTSRSSVFQPSLWSAEIFLVAQICWTNEIIPFEMLQVQQWRLRGFPFCILQPNKIHPFPSPFLGFRPIIAIKWQFVKGNTFFQSSLVAVAGSYTSLQHFYSQDPSCHSTFYVI